MLRFVRLTMLAGILANASQVGSAQEVENIDREARFTCPVNYKFSVVREKEPLGMTDGDWGDGTVVLPFLDFQAKRSGAIWDLTCRYGFEFGLPNPGGSVLHQMVFASLVRRVRSTRCHAFGGRREVRCDPPIDRGADVYPPNGESPPSPNPSLNDYEPDGEVPEPQPTTDRGSDVYQPQSETPRPPSPINRGLDIHQPNNETSQPPPPPPKVSN